MDLHLDGRVAVVTGASRGIGLAVTRALLAEGASVVTGSRSVSPELAALAQDGRVHAHALDLTDPDGPAELVARAQDVGPVDVLVNNAGAVRPRTEGFLAIPDAEWTTTFGLGFLTVVRTVRAVLPGMVERRRGAVVTVGSVNAFLPDPGVVDYSAAKAAVWNLSKSLSKEFGPQGVRFTTVSPGPVRTGLWLGEDGVAATLATASGSSAAGVVRAAEAGASTGRFTTPEEVAAAVVLLASDRTANITGADLQIDGGLVPTL